MIFTCKEFGQVTCEIQLAKSAMDCFITVAYTKERDLTDEEIEILNNNYDYEIQDYVWTHGLVREKK